MDAAPTLSTTSHSADHNFAADSTTADHAPYHEALGPPPSNLSASAATSPHPVPQSQAQSAVQDTDTPRPNEALKSIASATASMSLSTPAIHADPAGPSQRAMDYGNGSDMDVDMDADPFNKQKYARPPSSSRPTSQYLPASAAAGGDASARTARYSPMNTSPTSYVSSPPQQQQQQQAPPSQYASYTPQQQSARQSPSRQSQSQSQFTSPTQQRYYASPPGSARAHTSQLPPLQSGLSPGSYYPQSATQQLNAVFGHDSEPQKQQQPAQQNHHHQMSGTPDSVPQFTKVNGINDLNSHINSQPPFRRANPEGGFISPLQALTTHLPATYRICNPGFQYESSRNPRRVLTKPSKGVKNDGYDNEDSDYILYVNDILGSEETNHKNRYLILDVLGQGTFGQVVKCQNLKTQEVVAVKVIKNKTAYFNQSMMEVSVLDLLNGRMDKNDDHHILRLKDTFIHRQHLCLVFELLSVNLYELIKQNQFRGLSTTLVRVFAQQLLNGLCLLSKAKLIHCDLKPENILLKNLESPIIKVIDFGSACDERQTVYTYIQSRFYRSPEVLMGLPYSAAIDMWSLGCIVVELFLGLPLFPGSSEYNQVSRITEMLGLPPTWMLEVGKQSGEFFEKAHDDFGRRTYRLKPMEQYSREHGTKEQPSKKYFQQTRLPDIIRAYPMPRKGMKPAEMEREMANREAFIDFVHGLLNINPLERWSPQQARTHPFITQQKFTGPFQPQMNLKTTSRSPAPGVQQQQQAEALSKQRAQQAQAAQVQQQAANAQAYAPMPPNMHMNSGYASSPHAAQQQQQQAMYQNMYSPSHQGAPPPYPSNAQPPAAYGQQMPMIQQPPTAAMHPYAQQPQQNLYAQATTRGARQRATTMDGNGGIPASLQRVVSHLDPNAPIRLQPSPAYYPPPQDGQGSSDAGNIGQRRRTSRASGQRQGGNGGGQDRNFVRMLEDRTLEEGWNGGNGGNGWPGA
ncbi:related to serine/threonine-protein kinase minibrain [Ramularia collo-cygni]|uniref:Related to serine/threonine-protein kinase minibrain n=1 Tax=Ramularia collo-cygni TaxID=112498 RepID=A0A2D3V2R4_9PEZI|nr:related to serine/threonine-protein kinase minibrain [Ramularia collo-cygni]CZT15799.1 related to serine/threonine-protein kinase minibrain [Ramularia collo-cygni]